MKFDDRASQAVTAPGNTNFNFTNAVTRQGGISFDTFMTTTGDYTPYGADNGTAWETGYITKQANGTYARTVRRSTNGNAAVNFTTGTVSVSCDLTAWLLDNINFLEETVASATTCDIGAVQAAKILISGTTTITGLGSSVNKFRLVRFSGILTLTHNATSLILPGAANITTAAGDTAIFTSDASGNWRCYAYVRGDGGVTATTINLTSGQVVFPASQNASAGANTLDDYEEGTYTPGVSFGGGTTGITYSAQVGRYTKIGKRVFCQGTFTLSSKGSSTGAALLTGLPFASVNVSSSFATPALLWQGLNVGGVVGESVANGTTINLFTNTTGNVSGLADTNFTNTSQIDCSIHYEAAA